MIDLAKYRKIANTLQANHSHVLQLVADETKNLESVQEKLKDAMFAREFLQRVAVTVQRSAHEQISTVVSRCLKSVFGIRAYTFEIKFLERRGKTEAQLVFHRGDLELTDPLAMAGGGACDIGSFALRIACLALSVPKRRLFLNLDEPLKNLKPAGHFGPMVRSMLNNLSKEMGIQFFITQNVDEYRTGKVIRLGKDRGIDLRRVKKN